MKKVFALGVASLLMMGAASQAMASSYWQLGDLYMSVYDSKSDKEMGIDLGSTKTMDLTAKNVILKSGLNFSGFDFTDATSGIGLYSNRVYTSEEFGINLMSGYIGLSKNYGTSAPINNSFSGGTTFDNDEAAARSTYAAFSGGTNTALIAATNAQGYYWRMNTQTSPGYYSGLALQSGFEAEYPDTTQYVDVYLYKFDTVINLELEDPAQIAQVGGVQAVVRLTADGNVILNPSAVPVPGTSLLLGTALLGLAGVRRRQNN